VAALFLVFAMEPIPDLHSADQGLKEYYRPQFLHIDDAKASHEIHFGWPNGPKVFVRRSAAPQPTS
jgi:hypothetical protein